MKNLIKGSFALVAIGMSFISNAQCTVTAVPPTATITCGEEVLLSAQGVSSGPVLFEDFNNGTLGPGWSSSQTVQYNNPCGPSLDGTPSAWMGGTATQPRELITVPFDLQCGATICFDLDFPEDENNIDCEDPDAANEGVYLRYSINGGVTWVDITYFQPNSANTGPYYQWANYCFTLPPGGWSANTMFQWRQDVGSSANWDHWGIDNVSIQPVDCGNAYYYVWDDNTGNVGVGSGDSTMSPNVTTIYDVDYTNGIDDTCQTQFVVTVNPFNVDITTPTPVLDCGECANLNSFLNPVPANPNPSYSYAWTPAGTLTSDNTAGTTACPTVSTTYQVTWTEANSGCVGSETINITMNNGSAVAEFTPSVFQGCAPLNVNFTNTSTGATYLWNFGDGSPTSTLTNPSHIYATQGTYTVSLTASLPGAACADSTITATILVGNAIVPVADFDFTLECGIPTINCTNTGTPGLNYTWDMGDGSPILTTPDVTHAYASTGTYTITFTVGDPICGTSSSTTQTVNVVDNPITFISNPPTCHQFPDGSITINFTNNTGTEVVSILDSLGNSVNTGLTANNLLPGVYTVNVDLGGGCQADTLITLDDKPEIQITTIIRDVACNGDASGQVIVSDVTGYQGAYGNIGYYWNPLPTGVTNGIGSDTCFNMIAGTYVLTINDEFGCSNTFDLVINQPTPMTFAQLGVDPAYCRSQGFQVGNGRVFAAVTGGTPDYDYLWTNLQTGANTANTTWGGINPGQYTILAQDGNGCILTQTVTVDSLNPIADFDPTSLEFTADWEGTAPVTVTYTNTSQNYANPLNPNADPLFIWELNTDLGGNPILINDVVTDSFGLTLDTTFLVGGTYTACLVVVTSNDCKDTMCKDIIIYDDLVFAPVNIFTPNGDGNNDEFTFVHVSFAVAEFSCVVVNRWGVKIAEFNAITDTWDGKDASGSVCKDGTYFYTYEGAAENGELFSGQGNVTLITGP